MAAPSSECGLDNALRIISGKWKPTVIWILHANPLHFGEILRLVPGISEKVLTEQLRDLERDRVVIRSVQDGRVRRVLYELSDTGMLLNQAVHSLSEWGSAYGARTP